MNNNIFTLMVCFLFLMGYSSCNKEELNSNEKTVTAFDQYLEFANDMESENTIRSEKSYTIDEAVLNIEGGINVKYARTYPNVANEKVYNGILPLNGKSTFDSEEIKVVYNSILKSIADYYYGLDCTECKVLSLDVEFDHETQSLVYDMFVGEKLNEVRGPNSRHVFDSNEIWSIWDYLDCNPSSPFDAADQLRFKLNHNLRRNTQNGTFTNVSYESSSFDNLFNSDNYCGCNDDLTCSGIWPNNLVANSNAPLPNLYCFDGDYLNDQLDLIELFSNDLSSCIGKDFQRFSDLFYGLITGGGGGTYIMLTEVYYGDFHPTNTDPGDLPFDPNP